MATSTLAELEPGQRSRVDVGLHALFVVFVMAVLGAGLLGLLDPRPTTATGAREDTEVVVRYDSWTRPGLVAHWEVEVDATGEGPLPEQIEMRSTSSYFDLFDENALSPEPVEETTDGEHTTWIFEPPPGARSFTVSLDARVQPGWRGPEQGTTAVSLGDGPPIEVSYRTRMLP